MSKQHQKTSKKMVERQQNENVASDFPKEKVPFGKRIANFLKYYFVEPLQDIKGKKQNGEIPEKKSESSLWRFAFAILAIVSLIAMICMSSDAGTSGDEHFHYGHAKKVYDYYTTLGADSTAAVITEQYNLPYYGQSFDNAVYTLGKWFGTDDPYGFRHICNAIFGWLAMFFAGLIAFRIAGWRAGVFTLFLMFISPRFVGHSFNNLKDLPLATASVMALYFMVRFFQQFPNLTKKTAILLGFSIGLAISIRIGGLILVGYFGLFCLVYYIITYRKQGLFNAKSTKKLWKMFVWGLCIILGGYILAVLLWPFAMKAPIKNPMETLGNMTKFAISLRQIFEGKSQWSDLLPWYYTPKFILMTIPVSVILGVILYCILLWRDKKNYFYSFMIFFSFVFPVFWIIYSKSNVYGGWRHALFVYPSIVVFAGLGFNALVILFKNKYLRITASLLPFLLSIPAIAHNIRNHPYEYVYFNELAGGMKGAYGNYELDYYFHGLRQATEWTIDEIKKDKKGTEKIKLAGWILPAVEYYSRKDTADIQTIFTRYYERGNSDWDYAIFPNSGVSPERLRNGTYPPQETIHTINVDGKPIAIILKRTDKSDFYGYQQMQEGNIDSAKTLFRKALEISPRNEAVLTNMANIYLQQGILDSAEYYLKQFLSFDPNRESEKYTMAMVAYYKQDFNGALAICKEMTDYNKKFSAAYSLAANIYLQTNNPYFAEKELMKLMEVGAFDQTAFNQLMAIYKSQGLDDRTAQKKIFNELSKSYKKQGNKEMAKQFQEQADRI